MVGLAPRHTMPASGLHALIPAQPVSAAYVVGLMNSSAVQQLADSLPPGQLRQEDLTALRLPFIAGAEGDELARLTLEQADEVELLLRAHGPKWPQLRDVLRYEPDLLTPVGGAWTPEPGPRTRWGTAASVAWLEVEARPGPRGRPLSAVSVGHTLFGLVVEARDDRGRTINLRVPSGDERLAEAVALSLAGLQATGATLAGVLDAPMPTDPAALTSQLDVDRAELGAATERYRARRARIDEIVDALL